jgi:hypothetical protein
MDSPLHFDDNTESQPYRLRNAFLIDGHTVSDPTDNVTAQIHHQRVAAERFGQFGTEGGGKAKQFAKTLCKNLHHESEWCPCRSLTPDEIKALYESG